MTKKAPDRLALLRAAASKKVPQAPKTSAYLLVVSPNERGGRRFVRLKSPTVLGWFQRAWREAQRGAEWDTDLGGYVYGLGHLFDAIAEEGLECPASDDELIPLLEQHIYYENDIEAEAHFVHVETNDDEVDIEYFFFDDDFLKPLAAIDRLPSPERPRADDDDESAGDDDEGDAYARFVRKLLEARDA
jgi:hypothetical protein